MKRTVLDIMLKVAELGLLKANENEYNKINWYLQFTYGSMGYLYEVTDHNIYLYSLDDNDNEIKEDKTIEILTEMYGE